MTSSGPVVMVAAAAWQHAPGSVRRPPDYARRERSCAHTLTLPRRLWVIPTASASAPDALGLSARLGSHAGKSPRGFGSGRVPASPRVGVLRRRSSNETRPVAAHARHRPLSESGVSRWRLCRAAGHAVPALAGRGRLERGTRCARFVHGRGKTGGAIPRGEFAPSDPCRSDNPGASGATHMSSNRSPYSPRTRAQREYERSTFSGSRKPASDGQGRHCVGSEESFDSVSLVCSSSLV